MIYINKLFLNFLGILSLFPLKILYLLSDLLFFIIYYIARYRRNIVYNNLKNSFPEKTHKEIIEISKKILQKLL